MKFTILIFFLIICLTTSRHRKCGFSRLKKVNRTLAQTYHNTERELSEQDWQPLRIVPDYSQPELIVAQDPSRQRDLLDIKRVFDKTVSVLGSLLKVKRLSEPLKVDSSKCDNFDLPPKAQTSGSGIENADLLILVQFDTTGDFEREGVEAAATDCIQDVLTKRPVVGFIQFKPNLNLRSEKDVDYYVWLVLHEMTHVLGFNDQLYSSFIDSETLQARPVEETVAVTKLNGEQVMLIKSPNVLEKARKHYNCTRMQGVPVEYNGGEGTVGAHWAKRYLNTEYMIGDSYGENQISEITLALLQDSGWYKVDYTQANLFIWGKNAGCSFFDKPCFDRKTEISNFPHDFCQALDQEVCSNQNIFRAVCKTTEFEKALPSEKQFFADPRRGGLDGLVDHCPIAIEIKSTEEYYGGSCRFGQKGLRSFEKVGLHSACFENNLQPKGNLKASAKQFASCFEFECLENTVYLKIEEMKVECSKESVEIEGYSGKVKCPDREVLCDKAYFYKFGSVEKY